MESSDTQIASFLSKDSEETWDSVTKEYTSAHKSSLITNLINSGYKRPTYIQSRTTDFLSFPKSGVLAQSQNGTGKTLAYLVPSLLILDLKANLTGNKDAFMPQVIIATSNTILVQQIIDEIHKIGKELGENLVSKFYFKSERKVYEPGHIVVALPGHLEEMLTGRAISLENLKLFVVDEADFAIEKSEKSLKKLLNSMLKQKLPTSLFFISATFHETSTIFVKHFFKEFQYGDDVLEIA